MIAISRPESQGKVGELTMRGTRLLCRGAGMMLAMCMLAPAIALALEPWNVTVTPTMNPLPVGVCAAISVTVLDASTKDVPRNASGTRVTIADFDIVVAAPDGTSAVAQQIDSYHWSACACQGAAPGSSATVTATYPAKALAASARVPGVSFQKTAMFTIGAAKGRANPPACTAPKVDPFAAAASPGSARPATITASPNSTVAAGGVTASPGGVTAFPVRATASPVRATASPGGATAFPVRATASPVRATASPGGATASRRGDCIPAS